MIDPEHVPEVTSDEELARFIFYRNRVRQDGTVKPDALIPHPYPDTSVTRHLDATDVEVWRVGQEIGSQSSKTLQGRADLKANDCQSNGLGVSADPIPQNPNHAIIVGWPPEKHDQKLIAMKIACVFVPAPGT